MGLLITVEATKCCSFPVCSIPFHGDILLSYRYEFMQINEAVPTLSCMGDVRKDWGEGGVGYWVSSSPGRGGVELNISCQDRGLDDVGRVE